MDEVEGDGKGGWGDGGPDNDLRDFTLRGEQYLRGVLFNIIEPADNDNKSCIVLRGQDDPSVPLQAEIDINQTAAGVYFLHAGAWLSERVGQYVFVYEDGSEEVIEIVGGDHMNNWWGATETDNLRTAWRGTAPAAGIVSLGLFALQNPFPDKKIAKLRLQSYGDATYPMIVAITLTDKGPYLPKTKVDNKFNPDTSEWFPYDYPRNHEKISGTAMDASFLLDAPSGKHGFAKAEGESIIFEDGTKARFWGGNIAAANLYPSYEQAEYTATILAQRGFNLVRMHMYDFPYGEHNIFGWRDLQNTTRKIDKELLDKFHYLVYQMKIHGIYIFLDLCASRQVMQGDNIRDYQYLKDGLKHAVFYDEHLRKLQKETTEAFMGAVNPYTGLSSLEEPAIAIVNMNNEASIYCDNFDSPYYRGIITEKYNKWLLEQYGSCEGLRTAWKSDEKDELADGENPEAGTVKLYGNREMAMISGQRRVDNIRFLSKVMEDYTADMIGHYRSIGGKQMISIDTTWNANALAYAKGMRAADVVDAHGYFLHPVGPVYEIREGLKLPGEPTSWIGTKNTGLLSGFAAFRMKGKPYTISEWNSIEPNPYISDSVLVMAAYSGMQGWSPMQYEITGESMKIEYRDSPSPLTAKVVWTAADSPAAFDMLPAAAIAMQSVTEANGGYYKALSSNGFYETANQSQAFSNNSYLIAKAGVADKSLDNKQTGQENLTLAAEKYFAENKLPYVSLTNELSMDAENKIFKLNTPRSQAAAGFFAGTEIELEDVSIETSTEYATICLSSVTNQPIYESERLLLSAAARARKTDMKLSNDGTEVLESGVAPTLVEPVKAKFTLKTDANVEVWALTPQGEQKKKLRVEKDKTGVHFELRGDEQAINYEIVKKGGSKTKNPDIDLGVYKDTPIFKDVSAEAREVAERVYLTNIMRPTNDGMFSPNEPITRGDFVSALVGAIGLYGNTSHDFDDVSKTKSYYKAINTAKAEKLVFGKTGNIFAPDESITAEEANAILVRAGKGMYLFSGQTVSRFDAAKIMYTILTE